MKRKRAYFLENVIETTLGKHGIQAKKVNCLGFFDTFMHLLYYKVELQSTLALIKNI